MEELGDNSVTSYADTNATDISNTTSDTTKNTAIEQQVYTLEL